MGKIDILSIAKEAQIHKQKDSTVVDATIGMFYDDEKKLIINDVKEAYYNIDLFETFKYGATDGGNLFVNNAIDWVLSNKKEMIQSKYKLTGLATPGGSGALSVIFNSYGHVNDKVLVSNLRWRYEYFTSAAKKLIHEHNMFLGDAFDLASFEKELAYLCRIQETVIVVINDPCQNPTGYQLSESEWKKIVSILNKFNNNHIILVYDLAYFDYDPRGYEEARRTFEYFMSLAPHTEVLISFSASKSFAMYGVRLGGLIGLHHNESQYNYFEKNAYEDALGKWSTAPSVGVNIFNQLVNKKDSYLVTLNRLTNTLKVRGDIFIKEAKEANLAIYPYRGGFFVLVKSEKPVLDFEKLKEQGIYLIPMDEGLRIALCGITTDEVYGLAKRIKTIINKM
ncbi:pyridoxal phosphate-dependent aminotransferase [Acholeplasma hippikon]|uniref:Aromatic-amino-acid aminotransferase n=1 Tax=Acholeplasma hippikon TaxID=264636 RepID=A0A449BKK8_9MOLU|nr:aminotransferase class I/II-fold pyridoxal phosphate-dependent enzyme [Acholeplasma hippikon]VEU83015.1 Aromatic-amino-acid aminotransferase [Acholeplasma hippikon]